MFTLASRSGSTTAVSGSISLAITSDAGALITLHAIKWPAIPGTDGPSMATYAASTPPAVVAKPATMHAFSSDTDIFARYGRITRGASVCPTKTSATVEKLSAPLVPRTRDNSRPMLSITSGITRK